MPIDIKDLREDPERVRQHQVACFKKPPGLVDEAREADEKWRELTFLVSKRRQELKQLQDDVIRPKMKAGEDCKEELERKNALEKEITPLQQELAVAAERKDKLVNQLRNMVDPMVPISKNEEEDNLVLAIYPKPTDEPTLPCPLGQLEYTLPETKPLQHDDILWRIDGYEPIHGQRVAGHRGYFLTNKGWKLEHALIGYSVDFLEARGYKKVMKPQYRMNKDVMAKVAQLEDHDEQLYTVLGKTDDPKGDDEKYLIATSEQPLCAYHMGDSIKPETLPLRYTGVSRCFRKEAGTHGKDIRGIFRVHEFEKVEQFCITADDLELSQAEHERMLQCAKDFYESLGIPYQVVCLVSGELNDAAIKKYDLEGWFPGQQAYRELVSCSNCTDYQARAVGVRCGGKETQKHDPKARTSYCHFLNSTLCATGRVICAILENYQTEDGVKVPEVLQPYMGGIDFMEFVRGPMKLTKGERGQRRL